MDLIEIFHMLAEGRLPATAHEFLVKQYFSYSSVTTIKPDEKEFVIILILFGLCLADLLRKDDICVQEHMWKLKQIYLNGQNESLKELSARQYNIIMTLGKNGCSQLEVMKAAQKAMIDFKLI